jgi:hypothetical protein
MRAEAQPPRRRWPWVIGGAFLMIVIVVVVVALRANRAEVPAPTATTPSTTATTEPTFDAAPTGCLGGPIRDAAMILTAQEEAPHTSAGAVEVAASFIRWLNQYPYPTSADAELVAESAIASSAPTKDLVGFFETQPNLSGGLVPDYTPYFLSTVPGVYHVESSSNDTVEVTVGTALVLEGELSPTLKGSITVTVDWEDGGWKFVSSEGTRTTQDLFAIGQPFTDGC